MRAVAAALRINAGEGRLVGLQLALMFVASFGAASGQIGAETIVLTRYGVASLPYLFIALGVAMFATSLGVTALLSRVPRNRFFLSLPVVMACVLVAERAVLAAEPTWFYPVLWVLMTLFLNLQFQFCWGIAAAVVDARQAKRLFPIFGAGAIAGAVVGGLLTPSLLGWLRLEDLLLVWGAGLVGSLAIARMQLAAPSARPSPVPGAAERPRAGIVADTLAGYRIVRDSAMLGWMASAALLFALLAYLVWFSFSKAATNAYGDPVELAAFLARFQAANTATALLLSLFAANRLFARFGVAPMVLAWPAIHVLGFGGLVALASFPLMAVFRLGQLAWMQGVTNAAWQAIFSVVPPDQREKVRAFNSGVPSQLGTIAAGFLLLLAEGALAPSLLYALGLVVGLLAVFAVFRLGRAYRAKLVQAVREGWPHIFDDEADPFHGLAGDAAALRALQGGLSDPSPSVRRIAAEMAGRLPDAISTSSMRQALRSALADDDGDVRVAAAVALAANAPADAGERAALVVALEALLDDPEPETRREIITVLESVQTDAAGLGISLRKALGDADASVAGRAAGALLRLGPDVQAEAALLAMAIAPDPAVRARAVEPLSGWASLQAEGTLVGMLADPVSRVRRRAALVLGRRAASDAAATALIASLGDPDRRVRSAVAEAIEQMGAMVRPRVLAALSEPRLVDGALLALDRLPLAGTEVQVKGFAARCVDQALWHYDLAGRFAPEPSPRSEVGGRADAQSALLSDALLGEARQAASRAMRALGLFGDRSTVALALDALEAGSAPERLTALEALDAVEPGLVRPALRVWEPLSPHPDPDARSVELLGVLHDPDPWLRACAAAAVTPDSERDREVHRRLCELADDPDPIVRESASLSLGQGIALQTLVTLSTLDRILLLRRVGLFADLDAEELKEVAVLAVERQYGDGESLAQQGDECRELFVVAAGSVFAYLAEDGRAVEVARRGVGDYVGEMGLIGDQPHAARLVAGGDVRVLCIERHGFEAVLRERPETCLALLRSVCQRLQHETAAGRSGSHVAASILA